MKNREILFRAWHKKKNFMMEPHTIVDISWTEEVLHHRSTDYANSEFENRYQLTTFWNGDDFVGKDGTYWDVDFDDVILGQFTGLLDKNGKQIFEGDVCKDRHGEFVVKWDSDNARFLGYYSTERETRICYVGREPEIEVISNIHLKDK